MIIMRFILLNILRKHIYICFHTECGYFKNALNVTSRIIFISNYIYKYLNYTMKIKLFVYVMNTFSPFELLTTYLFGLVCIILAG